MLASALMLAMTLVLAAFAGAGAFGVYRSLRAAREERRAAGLEPSRGRSLRERANEYVGPLDGVAPPMSAPLRVLVEFWFSLMGFPGLGWLLSRRMLTGILLISVVPSLVWAIVPVVLVKTGAMTANVLSLVAYLPFVALASAGSLAIAEARARPREARA